ncbi:N-acetylmuramoyl-L-alanine amidase [Oceanobacillus locisalsi]|uniref:N-acetylmuramoyl-L-alanine amidase n=1 Tax=Oceanobacillus locisalsi TaxID=546107 RepID=A0ABW3NGI4_9BACI
MVNIKRQIVSSSIANSVTGGTGNPCNYIVVHETANTNKGAGAQNHANLQSNGNSRRASWHYTVDDSAIVQSFDDTRKCWHAGNSKYNNNGIGIEIAVNPDSNFKQAVQNAADLIKHLMSKHNISAGNVVQHKTASGKDCPHFLRSGSKGVTWSDLKTAIGSSSGNVGSSGGSSSSGGGTSWKKVTGNWTGQTLGNGEYGNPIKQMQTMLANNNPPFFPNKGAKNNGIDSYFGGDTEDAVRRFQSYYGLDVDGLPGKQVYSKLNGSSSQNAKNSKKSVAQMAKEVKAGKHGNGHDARRKSLGISQSEYNKVREYVNKGSVGGSGKSVSQMANEVIQGKHGSGHSARRKSLGISKSKYEQVRKEVNKRL